MSRLTSKGLAVAPALTEEQARDTKAARVAAAAAAAAEAAAAAAAAAACGGMTAWRIQEALGKATELGSMADFMQVGQAGALGFSGRGHRESPVANSASLTTPYSARPW